MKLKKEFLVIISILVMMSYIILPQNLGDLDELWNYNFARNIVDGKLPYQDFNMLQTPLLPIIISIFLKIFGNELIVTRVLAIILCTAIFFIEYKILERLKINSYASLLFTLFTVYLFKDHVRIDYNFAVLLITLILIYIESKPKKEILEHNQKKDFLIGVLAGTAILFKQTTGIVLTLVTICYRLLIVENKEQLKVFLKSALIRTIGAIIPVIVFIIYLIISGTQKEFISYTILGVKTFSNSIAYTRLFENDKWIIKVLAVAVPISLIVQYVFGVVKNNKTEKNRKYLTLFSYSVAACIVMFPITDEIHFLIGSVPCIIAISYIVYELGVKILKGKVKIFFKYFIKCASIGILLYCLFISIKPLKEYIQNANKYNQLEHFKYIPIQEGLQNQIEIVDNYIKTSEKEVYILDATAAIYRIPINQYYKDYDMFLKGNLGKDEEEGIIKKLQEKQNIKVLIMKEGKPRNWQNPEQVRKYIQENWNKTGEIACFEIYER